MKKFLIAILALATVFAFAACQPQQETSSPQDGSYSSSAELDGSQSASDEESENGEDDGAQTPETPDGGTEEGDGTEDGGETPDEGDNGNDEENGGNVGTETLPDQTPEDEGYADIEFPRPQAE